MLRKVRVGLALIFFVLITLLFLDITGVLHQWLGWLAKVQFLPALLAVNVVVIVGLVLLTLLFGRIYCSVICPLGVFQDVISWMSSKRKKNRFRYSPALSWLRYGVLVLFIVAFVAGVGSLVSLLDPYAAYGRIANNLFAPFYEWGNNILAFIAERMNSYTFYPVDVWMKSGITFVIALITFAALAVLAWRNGRTYCNTICPVGTVLGLLSRFSFLRPTIDVEKCTRCNKCARNCKSSCIDIKSLNIDYSRCVTCMDCIGNCKFDAMKYVPRGKVAKAEPIATPVVTEEKKNNARRNFLSISTFLAVSATVKAQQVNADGGLADIIDKKQPDRMTPIVPPGSLSQSNFAQHCTGCQLCVSVCPNQILRPSTGLMTLMQPEMSYERGYCRPECVKCSEVCPAGAIRPITKADKSAIQIGHAVWIKDNCVVNRDDVTCTACKESCPTSAIQLVPRDANDPESLKIPVVDNEMCIGCGACENLCPSRPFSAIYVEGHERHRII